MIAFGEFAPDRATFNDPGVEAKNVYFYGDHWRPLPSLQGVGSALTGRAYAALGGKSSSGVSEMYAATQKRLWRLSGSSWTDVSRGGVDYTVDASAPNWQIVQSGSYIIACNHADTLQYLTLGAAGTFADIAGADQPKARRMGQLQQHLVVGDTNDASDGDVPHRVWWPKQGDPLTWPTRGTSSALAALSSYKDLEKSDGRVTAIAGSEYGVIFQERAITRMSFIGAPQIYQFDRIDKLHGCICPNAVAQAGTRIFFYSLDGFYVTNGTGEAIPIGNGRVNKFVSSRLDMTRLELASAAIDEQNHLFFFAFPSTSGTAFDYNDTLLIYNYDADKWSRSDIAVELLGTSVTPAVTLENMDAFGTVDAQTVTWDSPLYQGGVASFAGFDTTHKLATFSGTPGTSVFTTGDFSDDGGKRINLTGVRPIVEGGSPSIRVGSRSAQTGTISYSPSRTVNSRTGFADFHEANNFYHNIEVTLTGDFGKAAGVDLRQQLGGAG